MGALRQLGARTEATHVHAHFGLDAYYARAAARLGGVGRRYTTKHIMPGRSRRTLSRTRHRWLAAQCETVFAVSDAVAGVLVYLGVPSEASRHVGGASRTGRVRLSAVTSQKPVGTRTLRGMFWAYGSYVAGRGLVLVSIAIMARLLTPAQFGLVAFALTATALLDTVSDLGVSQALVLVKDEEVYAKADTAWTLGVILGAALTVITAALAPVVAAFFDEPELKILMPILGVNFLLRALGVTHFALAQKQIDFRTRTIAEMADVLVRGTVGIGLALAGAGAYSLVVGYLAGSLALTAALWLLIPWRPSPRLRREDLGGLLRFGGGITVLDIISAIITNADYVAVGRVLGQAKLGLYTLGYRLPELIIVNLSLVAGMVLFPAFAGIERHALADAFLTSLRYILMVCIPMGVGLAVLADSVVLIAFGPQWAESAAVMQVLTLSAFGVTLDIPAGTAYKSIGRVDVLVKLAIPRAILAVGSIVLFVQEGIVAVAACQAAVACLFSLINISVAARMLGTGGRRIWAAAWPPCLAGAVLTAVLVVMNARIDDPYITIGMAVPVGAPVYFGTLWLVAPDVLRKLRRTAFPGAAR